MQTKLQRWLLLAPLAFTPLVVHPAQAKERERQTPPDFLLNRKFQQGVSLFDVARVRGNWDVARYATINGYPYRRSLVAKAGDSSTLTVKLDKKFDRFQAWVGTREGGSRGEVNVFRVLGDGQELYKSPELSSLDAAVRINAGVRDVTSLQLIVEGPAPVKGAFAEPRFVKAVEESPTARENASAGSGELLEVTRPEGGPVGIQLGGKTLDFGEDEVLVRGNRVLVPMLKLFEQIGATVDHNTTRNEITAQRGADRIQLTVGSTAARVNGKLVYLDVPTQTKSAAMISSTLTPTKAPTSSPLAPPGTAALGSGSNASALPDLRNPGATGSKTVIGTIAHEQDTETTVSKAENATVDAAKAGPILVPLRFVAEAFNLPVGFQEF